MNDGKIEEIKKEIDKKLGKKEREALLDLVAIFKRQVGDSNKNSQEIRKALNTLEGSIRRGNIDQVNFLRRIFLILGKFKIEIPKEFSVFVKNQVKFPKEVDVGNLADIKFPREIGIKKPSWLQKELIPLTRATFGLPIKLAEQELKVRLTDQELPVGRALPVRLVDKDGKRFYTASFFGGGGRGGGIPFMTSTERVLEALIDDARRLVTIEIEHYKVHEGDFYTVSDYDSGVDIAAPRYWLIRTPNTSVRAHMKVQVASDTGSLIELFENPTWGSGNSDGSPLTAYNNDRNSGNAPTMLFFYDPVIGAGGSDGTLIEVGRIGAGREKKLGGTARQPSEIILKQNEEYIVKYTPDSNGAEITINIGFYEV